jgi:hypothetical protein
VCVHWNNKSFNVWFVLKVVDGYCENFELDLKSLKAKNI